jgi:hypothetical protein
MGARWYDPELGRWSQPDTIVPGFQGNQGLDRYAYVNNSPLRYRDPSGHNFWDVVGDFSTGFVSEFALSMPWAVGPGADALRVSESDSTAKLAGRIAGDVAAIVIGVETSVAGAGAAGSGGVVCITGVGCVVGAPAIAVGATAMAVGAVVAGKATANLGENLAQLSGKSASSNQSGDRVGGIFEKNGIETTDHFHDSLKKKGISEKRAYKAYENGKNFTDPDGQRIKFDPKTGLAIVVDPTDGKVITVWETDHPSSNWTQGWWEYWDEGWPLD